MRVNTHAVTHRWICFSWVLLLNVQSGPMSNLLYSGQVARVSTYNYWRKSISADIRDVWTLTLLLHTLAFVSHFEGILRARETGTLVTRHFLPLMTIAFSVLGHFTRCYLRLFERLWTFRGDVYTKTWIYDFSWEWTAHTIITLCLVGFFVRFNFDFLRKLNDFLYFCQVSRVGFHHYGRDSLSFTIIQYASKRLRCNHFDCSALIRCLLVDIEWYRGLLVSQRRSFYLLSLNLIGPKRGLACICEGAWVLQWLQLLLWVDLLKNAVWFEILGFWQTRGPASHVGKYCLILSRLLLFQV